MIFLRAACLCEWGGAGKGAYPFWGEIFFFVNIKRKKTAVFTSYLIPISMRWLIKNIRQIGKIRANELTKIVELWRKNDILVTWHKP